MDSVAKPFLISMKHQPFIDWLRMIAAFCVVLIHVTARFVEPSVYQHANATWWLAFVINSCSRFAVPIFLMISGYLLLGRNESWLSFYRHRYARLLPPFLFWNLVYLLFGMAFAHNMGVQERLKAFLYSWASASHLWYLPMLLSVLMVAPLLNSVVTKRRPRGFDWCLLLGGILAVFCYYQARQPAASATPTAGWLAEVKVPQVFAFLKPLGLWPNGLFFGYLLLGYVLGVHADRFRPYMPLCWICALSGLAFGLVADGGGMRYGGRLTSFEYLGLTVCLLSIAVFLSVALYAGQWSRSPWVRKIAECSFGIYLIHMIFLRVHDRLLGNWYLRIAANPFVALCGFLCTTLAVFLLSFVVVVAVRKHRVGRVIC